MTNDVQFEFLGFSPDDQIKNVVSSIVDRLHSLSPSDSNLKLVVERSKNAIRASCRIASQAGVFVAEAISDNPIRAVQKMDKKIHVQINRWKMGRFERR